MRYVAHDAQRRPLDAQATLDLIRQCRRFFVKVGDEVFLWDRDQEEVPDEALRRHFVHPDGFIRIPVLLLDSTTAVRGFLPEIYTELLSPPANPHQTPQG